MTKLGKYRSRRRARPKKGGAILGDAIKAVTETVAPVRKVLKEKAPLIHRAVQAVKRQDTTALKMLAQENRHETRMAGHQANIHIRRAQRKPFIFDMPDRSTDLRALAKAIRSKHVLKHLPKLGGGLDAATVVDVGNKVGKLMNPLSELEHAKGQYDKIDFSKTSARGMAQNAAHAYSGNFAIGAAHLKTAGIIAPPFAPVLGAAGSGFSAVSRGFSKVAKVF